MKTYVAVFLIFVAGAFLIGQQTAVSQNQIAGDDGMLIHITHGYGDAHRVLMALQMARIMSDEKKVLVYLDIEAVQFVLKNSKDIMYQPFPTAHTQLSYLMEHGVTIMACPGCLQAAGKSKDDLMPGINVASKEAFYNFADGKIITLDY